MSPNIADHIVERIRATFDQVGISASYREFALSVVAEVACKFSDEPATRIPTAFLPAIFTAAFGGGLQKTLGVSSAWFLLQLSAHLLDKIEDQELQELDETVAYYGNPALILNLTTGLIFTAEYLLDRLEQDGVDSQAAADIRAAFNRYLIGVCGGQHEDLWFPQPDLALCWQIARLKSGLFFGLGCYAGARVVTSDADSLSAAWNYGNHLGLIKQIADDVESFVEKDDKHNDLVSGKWTLPIAYSMQILPSDHADALRSMLQCAPTDATVLTEARDKMIQSGALVYLKLEMLKYAFEARKAIASIKAPNFDGNDLSVIMAQTAGMEEHELT